MFIVVSAIAFVAGLLYAAFHLVLHASLGAQIIVAFIGVLVLVALLAEPMTGAGTLISVALRHPVRLARRYWAQRRSGPGR